MHIGLFDSGVGGLTVLRELLKQIPDAQYTYLGDSARLPYGNKAPETLKKYTAENIDFLDSQSVDVIVIACHSASSASLQLTKSPKGAPVFNVIAPSCKQAQASTQSGAIGVMATKATIRSNVYTSYISDLDKDLKVTPQECPLLVPLVEEGLINDEVTSLMLRRYLTPLLSAGVDTILLGCTHYPILKAEIAKICGKDIQLIDPADSVAQEIKKSHGGSSKQAGLNIYLTDHAPHFVEHAQSLLGSKNVTILYPGDMV